jgi:hypothetical protein
MMVAGIIVGAVGVLFLVIGVISWMRIRRFLRTAASTKGEVVGFEQQVSTDSDGDTTSSTHAQVMFTTADGRSVTFTERTQTMGGLALGSAVPVKYDRAEPDKARIATSGRLWVTTIVLAALGAVMVIIGVALVATGG